MSINLLMLIYCQVEDAESNLGNQKQIGSSGNTFIVQFLFQRKIKRITFLCSCILFNCNSVASSNW